MNEILTEVCLLVDVFVSQWCTAASCNLLSGLPITDWSCASRNKHSCIRALQYSSNHLLVISKGLCMLYLPSCSHREIIFKPLQVTQDVTQPICERTIIKTQYDKLSAMIYTILYQSLKPLFSSLYFARKIGHCWIFPVSLGHDFHILFTYCRWVFFPFVFRCVPILLLSSLSSCPVLFGNPILGGKILFFVFLTFIFRIFTQLS